MPWRSASTGAVDDAVTRLSAGPENSWDSPSRFGVLGLAYRRLLRRALRPYDVRRREVDESLARALRELGATGAGPGAGPSGPMPSIWSDEQRGPHAPLGPIGDLLGTNQPDGQLAAIAAAIEAASGFGKVQGTLLRELGPAGVRARLLADRDPIPAPDDRQRYSGDDHLAYWLSGLGDSLLLQQIAIERGRPLQAGFRILDFGCASGRVLRHLNTAGVDLTLLGVDIGLVHVEWARRHLPAAITIAQTTVLPALPLEDESVDVVYAGSVFTHVADFEESTLLELYRVLRPDGFALLTIHAERLWDDLCAIPDFWMRRVAVEIPHRAEPMWVEPVDDSFFAGPMPADRVVLRNVAAGGLHNTNVIHSERWLRERWGRFFGVERVVRAVHGSHQDGLVLRRR